jgi:hypothetical protein
VRAAILIAIIGCSGAPASTTPKPAVDGEAVFAPLDVGADYASYTKLTDKPFLSLDHGNRWVDVYVNSIGVAAYDSSAAIPVGTIVVKTSVEDDDGKPSSIAGPIYVMQKRATGYAPGEEDWWYAIHWAQPIGDNFKEPIYWRGKSPRVDYCANCHSSYERSLGGLIPSSILKR